MRQKQAPLRVEDDIESEDITMAAAVSEDFHRESGDGLCGDFSCPHCAFSVDQDVMLKVLKHFFNCTSLQYIIDISVGNAATLGATKPPAPRRASKAPQPHSEPVRHSEPPTKRRATEARATPPQESPRIVTTQAPTLLARLNAAQSRTQTVHASSQREIPSEPEHHTRPVTTRQVETVQPRAPETTTTTTTAANIQLPSIPTIKEEPGAGAACIVEPTAPTLFDEPMHTQKDTDSAMGMKRDTDTVGGMLDALPGTSSSGLFSEDLNFGGAGPSFVQSDPSQEDSTSGNGCHKTRTGLLEETVGGPSPWQHDVSRPEPPAFFVPEGPRDHLCISCGKSFDSHQTLVSHVQLHHQLPQVQLPGYYTEMAGDSHPGATASSGGDSAGPGYPVKYGNPEGTLEDHPTFHSPADAARYAKLQRQKRECAICGVELSNKYNHDRHVKLKHSDLRDFACTWCGKAFKLREHLQRHMLKNHMPQTGFDQGKET
ncbi:hypermethylated in cancer 1 protein-like isoform X41 [Branchiostoma lanceolatum]|uniref:hypermethylated in cancer 1 protein-like isoform X41 n=1 Tax=Branchiostoma lanceolatum TaxID=7740 RepID=UPI003451B30A